MIHSILNMIQSNNKPAAYYNENYDAFLSASRAKACASCKSVKGEEVHGNKFLGFPLSVFSIP